MWLLSTKFFTRFGRLEPYSQRVPPLVTSFVWLAATQQHEKRKVLEIYKSYLPYSWTTLLLNQGHKHTKTQTTTLQARLTRSTYTTKPPSRIIVFSFQQYMFYLNTASKLATFSSVTENLLQASSELSEPRPSLLLRKQLMNRNSS